MPFDVLLLKKPLFVAELLATLMELPLGPMLAPSSEAVDAEGPRRAAPGVPSSTKMNGASVIWS